MSGRRSSPLPLRERVGCASRAQTVRDAAVCASRIATTSSGSASRCQPSPARRRREVASHGCRVASGAGTNAADGRQTQKTAKTPRPPAARPRRSRPRRDRGDAARWSRKSARSIERYGFEPVETPAMEYTDALGKFLPDQDRPNEGVFSFQDDDEQWISLRYDLTAPLARYVAENFDAPAEALSQLPRRLCLPQREAGPGPLPPVHAVRRRHGGLARRRRPMPRCA